MQSNSEDPANMSSDIKNCQNNTKSKRSKGKELKVKNRKGITMLVQWLCDYASVSSDPLVLRQPMEAGHNCTRVLLL